MTSIRWLGHAAFEIVSDRDKHIYLDPYLDKSPTAVIKSKDIKKADIVCVSHGHRDHIGDAITIAKNTGATLIGTPEIAYYADSKGVTWNEGSCPLNYGGSATIGGVTIHMVLAFHTSEIYGEEWENEKKILPGSGAVGYVLETENDVRIYYAGDTGLFGDMKFIGEIYKPQVALLPVGGKFNMGPKLAGIAVQWIRPEVVIPMHFGTYPLIKQDPKVIEKELSSLPGVKVVILQPGETFEYGN